jgi:hypothetical protein
MWLISFRGEATGDVNNILAFDDDGQPASPSALLPTGATDPPLFELRGFQPTATGLYVANAHNALSRILVYKQQQDGTYAFSSTFTSGTQTRAVFHPFDLTQDDSSHWYVSNQDSNVVAAFDSTGKPLPLPAALSSWTGAANFLPGTFVASSVGALPGVPTPAPPDVPGPLGLAVSPPNGQPKVSNSVRGLAYHGGTLYVADEPGNAVKAYDVTTGLLVGQIAGANLSSPVHLLCAVGGEIPPTLFVGSTGNDGVVTFDLSSGPPSGIVAPASLIDGSIKHASGMDFGADGLLYVAERKAMKIKRFAVTSSNGTMVASPAKHWEITLADELEFIHYVPNS